MFLQGLHHKESSLSYGCHYHCSSRGFLKLLTGLEAAPSLSLSLSLSAGCFWQLSCNPSESCQPIHQCYKHNTRREERLTSPRVHSGQHNHKYPPTMHRKEINQSRTIKSGSLSNRVSFVSMLRFSRNKLEILGTIQLF